MAIVKSTLGKFSGRLGHLILYKGRDGQMLCRSEGVMPNRKSEQQKRHCEAFGTVVKTGRYLLPVIQAGFPGEKQFPAGMQGFIRANVNTAVTVTKTNPEKAVSAQKRAPQEFQGEIDFSRLQVSDGSLEAPEGVTATVDAEEQTVRFSRQEMGLESPNRFRDDELYGVVVSTRSKPDFRLFSLGVRGEADERSFKIASKYLRVEESAVYVFATSADGRKASPSVCLSV